MGRFWLAFITISFSPCVFSQMNPSPSGPVSSAERYQALETFAKALFYLESMYVDREQVKLPRMVDNALDGIFSNLDPHSVHLNKHAFDQLTSDTKGQIGGVGISIKVEHNKLIIFSVQEGKPAKKAGIKAGDEIVGVNDVSVAKAGMSVLDLMPGEVGSSLKLTIRRKDLEKPLEFTMTREVIQVSSVITETLGHGLYYAHISSFQENTGQDLQNFLTESASKGPIGGFVLDLRNNPGGLLEEAVKVANLFIESGLIVSTVGRFKDKIEREFAHKQNTFSGFPLILLINEGSASASEIVAGALQDHQRALIMGSPSFGKGSVQTLIALPDGSGIKLTVATYYTPNDRSIQAKGIQPDILLSRQANKQDLEMKKEANLKGHLLSEDLSDFAKKSTILSELSTWPSYLSEDYQVVTAFTYLKGWVLFKPKQNLNKSGI